MRLLQASEPGFARHETFHPRWGWFTKAVRGAERDPGVFLAENATVELGVGKNMVRAIRFWGLASRLLTLAENPEKPRQPRTVVSKIGQALMGEEGRDPFLEDPATLWLLHWLMLTPPSQLPVWWLALSGFRAVEFSEETLVEFVVDEIGSVAGWQSPHDSSVRKDVSCFLRMYSSGNRAQGREGADDFLDCPFRDLGLLRVSVIDGTIKHRFVIGAKPSLPPEIVAYAVFDFLARTDAKTRTVTVGRLATEPGAPGHAFKLTEVSLTEELETAVASVEGIKMTRVAGVPQLTFQEDPAILATRFLSNRYSHIPSGLLLAGPTADLPADSRFKPVESKRGKRRAQSPKGIEHEENEIIDQLETSTH